LKQIFLELSQIKVIIKVRLIFLYLASKKSSSVDPDEDEPHLEEAWPHL
jgi:hypothetical protein